jgi:hypothetical protein
MSEEELQTLHEHFHELVRMAKRDGNLTRSHSIDEAKVRHEGKLRRHAPQRPHRRRERRHA